MRPYAGRRGGLSAGGPRNGFYYIVYIAVVGTFAERVVRLAVAAAVVADWREPVEVSLDRPFTLRYVFAFGALFLLVVVAGDSHKRGSAQPGSTSPPP